MAKRMINTWPISDTEEFGISLQEITRKKSISQEKFALLIDMDRTYYSYGSRYLWTNCPQVV